MAGGYEHALLINSSSLLVFLISYSEEGVVV